MACARATSRSAADDDALAGGQAVVLDDVGRGEPGQRGVEVGRVVDGHGGGGGHAGGGHDVLGEALGALDPGGRRARPEAGDPGGPHRVGDPGDQRHLGPDHHQVGPPACGQRATAARVAHVQAVLLGDRRRCRRCPARRPARSPRGPAPGRGRGRAHEHRSRRRGRARRQPRCLPAVARRTGRSPAIGTRTRSTSPGRRPLPTASTRAAVATLTGAPPTAVGAAGHRRTAARPGYRPEHTLASYELAARMGADYLEPDLVATADGVLVARHEPEIGGTTDVADAPGVRRPAHHRRSSTATRCTGWFVEDFTLAELQHAARRGAASRRCARANTRLRPALPGADLRRDPRAAGAAVRASWAARSASTRRRRTPAYFADARRAAGTGAGRRAARRRAEPARTRRCSCSRSSPANLRRLRDGAAGPAGAAASTTARPPTWWPRATRAYADLVTPRLAGSPTTPTPSAPHKNQVIARDRGRDARRARPAGRRRARGGLRRARLHLPQREPLPARGPAPRLADADYGDSVRRVRRVLRGRRGRGVHRPPRHRRRRPRPAPTVTDAQTMRWSS